MRSTLLWCIVVFFTFILFFPIELLHQEVLLLIFTIYLKTHTHTPVTKRLNLVFNVGNRFCRHLKTIECIRIVFNFKNFYNKTIILFNFLLHSMPLLQSLPPGSHLRVGLCTQLDHRRTLCWTKPGIQEPEDRVFENIYNLFLSLQYFCCKNNMEQSFNYQWQLPVILLYWSTIWLTIKE